MQIYLVLTKYNCKMKKITTLLILIFLAITLKTINAQDENIFDKRKTCVESLEIYKGSIVDSTKEVLKQLVKIQDEVITSDKAIIEVYLDSLETKADSLNRTANNLTNDKLALETKVKTTNEMIFYGMIGAGVIFVLFLLFLILFIVANGKKNKSKKQFNDIENIKEANQKEIDLSKKEVQTLKANTQKEIASYKENLAKEVKNLQAKIDSQIAEKANLEKRLNDKAAEGNNVQLQIVSMKQDFKKRLSEAKASSGDFSEDKKNYENEINDKNLLIEKFSSENNLLNDELSNYKRLYDTELNERKIAEEKLANKEVEYKSNISSTSNSQDSEDLILESSNLKEEINRLNIKLEKEINTKNMIEDELRKFIEELRNPRL